MSTQSPLPQNDPMLIAFQKLKKTPEYQNAVKWTIKAENESQADGELWFAFAAGYEIAKRLQEELQEKAKVSCRCGHKESEHKSLDSRPFGKWNCTYCRCVEYDAVTDEPFSGGLGDEATQRAWMRYADANEVPHDHEDEEAFKYGFDAGRSVENTKAILRWKTRCEELEVVAAALYLHQDGCRDQFELYRSVYLVPDFSRKSITCPRCGIVRNEGEMRICCM